MKKLWKNICACSVAVACGVGVAGCGDDGVWKTIDLDGDGVISSWENIFETSGGGVLHGSSSITANAENIVNITNAEQLLQINDRVQERKCYVLRNDIDLGGAKVSINLGESTIYGQGHVIRNFKLGNAKVDKLYNEHGYSAIDINALFYNGVGAYDLKIFAGVQSLNINSGDNNSYHSLSIFYNTNILSGISVKGKGVITSQKVDGRARATVDVSLLYAGMKEETESAFKEFDENIVSIEHCDIDGEIAINDAVSSMVGAKVGMVASSLSQNSSAYDVKVVGKIAGTVFAETSYVGGLVGRNEGFLSTGVYSGEITLNNNAGMLYCEEFVGGIVGINCPMAEVKNCSTTAKIGLSGNDGETSQSRYVLGGLVGKNDGGIIELGVSDAVITLSGLGDVAVGGFCGSNERGILSYGICRGSIQVNKTQEVMVAQVVGSCEKGYLEKIVTNTIVGVSTTGLSSVDAEVGLVVVFKEVANAPYMYRVMADAPTTIYYSNDMVSGLNVDVSHGLRHTYTIPSGETNDDGEDIMISALPNIFKNVFVSTSCKLLVSNGSVDNGAPIPTNVTYNTAIGDAPTTPRSLMDDMDFKNYLNHNEVQLGDVLSIKDLRFTISDESEKKRSYFGYSRYNGELAYFDREFVDYYQHEQSALGYCEHDSQDELLSFVYNLIEINNGKDEDNYVVKITDEFLGMYDIDETLLEGLSAKTFFLKERLSNVFTCLNVVPTLTRLNASGVDVFLDGTGDTVTKYLMYTFADNNYSYTMKVDLSELDQDPKDEMFSGEYYLYITFIKGEGPTV